MEKTNAKDLVLHYAKRWKEKYGQDYPIAWSKEVPQFKRLLKTYSAEQMVVFIDYFLTRYRDSFADRVGYHVGAFLTHLPKIVANAPKQEASVDETEYSRLEQARRRLK